MARIAGVNIPDNKHTVISLTYVFGIGRPTAQQICADLNIEESTKVRDLGEEKLDEIRNAITTMNVEGDLRREISMNIKRLMNLGCYRGLRHRRSLPLRGQRTTTKSPTRKTPTKPIPK